MAMTIEPVGNHAWPGTARAWWAVVVLQLAYTVSFIDRTILSLMVEPIKRDLNLTDTEVGLLQGLAFGIFYTLMGIPLGWLADRLSRRNVIVSGIAVWCLATAVCGAASNFWHLFLARVGVGAGEAALNPSALSMISDYFPPERRALAISVFQSAASIGSGLALMLGSLVISAIAALDGSQILGFAAFAPWRTVFVIVGLSGLLVAVLMYTVSEPPRRGDTVSLDDKNVGGFLHKNRGLFARHFGGFALFSTLAYGVLSWVPTYFIRVHGWSVAETGLRYGSIFMLFGVLGAVAGGWLASWLRSRGVVDANLRVAGFGILLLSIPATMAPLMASGWLSLLIFGPVVFLFALPSGVSAAAIQEVTPNRYRARVTAVYYVVVSLVGLTFGPLVIAIATDHLFGHPTDIGKSLALTAFILGPLGGLLMISAIAPYKSAVAQRAVP